MHYLVTARLKPGTAAALRTLLEDGTIARQKPDGAEIVASMARAASGPTARSNGRRSATARRRSPTSGRPSTTGSSTP